jgi:hypothetical protein
VAEISMNPQFYIGRGINSTTGRIHGVAIDFDSIEPGSSGQKSILALGSITSTYELMEQLSIDIAASFKKLTWGVSAEFRLAQSREINSYYTYALVQVLVMNPPQMLRNPKLKPEARTMLEGVGGWEAFSKSYGWEYVEGIISGGSYYGLIEIQTTSEKQ